MPESVQTLLMIVGACTVLFFVLCAVCMILLTMLVLWDKHQTDQNAKLGKHQTSGKLFPLPADEDIEFFDALKKKDISEAELQAESLATLKRRLTSPIDETMIHAPVQQTPGEMEYPFNMKGEVIESSRGAHKA